MRVGLAQNILSISGVRGQGLLFSPLFSLRLKNSDHVITFFCRSPQREKRERMLTASKTGRSLVRGNKKQVETFLQVFSFLGRERNEGLAPLGRYFQNRRATKNVIT